MRYNYNIISVETFNNAHARATGRLTNVRLINSNNF